MTAPSPGRSWGGSALLDQVLAQTLDPAYATAASARAGRQPPGSRRGGRVAVALVMVIAGLLAASAYNITVRGEEGRQVIRAALIADIADSQEAADALSDDLVQAAGDVAAARDAALAVSVEGRQALAALDTAEQLAGTAAVSGPGMLVVLADAEPDTDSDPVGAQPGEDPNGQVRDGDLQLVVNALWAAGAEAVSINGQRLGPTTAIRFAGEAVLVDFRPVTSPYRVSAIGDPDTLSSQFLLSTEVRSLALISESFGLRFDFSREDEIALPAARTPELREASTVPPPGEQPAPDADPDPAPDPGTDPGTGGGS